MRPPVFMTGATGFLGMEVLARLLEAGDREVVCLVRAADTPAAEARLDGVLETLWEDPRPYRANVRAIAGDLTEPGLGMDLAERAALGVEVGEGDGERLERVGARAERELGALGRRLEEPAAQGVLRRERDRMQHAVHAAPALAQLARQRLEVGRLVDVELQHVRRLGEPLSRPLGHAARAPERCQDDLRAGLLRLPGDLERDRLAVKDAGDEELLAVEHGHSEGRHSGMLRTPWAGCAIPSRVDSASQRRRRVSPGRITSST